MSGNISIISTNPSVSSYRRYKAFAVTCTSADQTVNLYETINGAKAIKINMINYKTATTGKQRLSMLMYAPYAQKGALLTSDSPAHAYTHLIPMIFAENAQISYFNTRDEVDHIFEPPVASLNQMKWKFFEDELPASVSPSNPITFEVYVYFD